MVVLVIYKMKLEESPAFLSLTKALQFSNQSTALFIYDNSPHSQICDQYKNWKIVYRHNATNPGVSKAYNEGFALAKSENKEWMLLVDQDTHFEKDLFLKYEASVKRNSQEKIFVPILRDTKGVVSPFVFKFGRGIRLRRIEPNQHLLSQKKFINSGLLITSGVFEQVEGYDEKFKLDFSDMMFIQKLSTKIPSFWVVDSQCTHSLSSSKRSSLEETLSRFELYSRATNDFHALVKNSGVKFWKYFRAVVLGLRHLNGRFLIIAFSK